MAENWLKRNSLALFFFIFPSMAMANVVWPGLILAERMTVWAIPAGLIIETAIFTLALKRSFVRSFGIVVAVNIFSTILGAVGAAFGGIVWEASVGLVFYKFLNIGTFNPATWIFTIGVAAYISYFFEMKALKWFFKIELEAKEKRLFLMANVVSTLVAFSSIIFISPF